jgi:hypothetical protein
MSSLGLYLDSVALPIVRKVLVGLGFGTVTYLGLQAAFDQAQAAIQANFSGMIPQIAALVYLAGFNQAVGMVLAALSAKIGLIAVKKFQLI